jgi:hypothetical protein
MLFFRNVIFFAFLFLLNGCRSAEIKSSSIGKESELLIVCNDDLYRNILIRELINVLTNEYPALPQQEPLFDIIRITDSGFSELFRRHKSILKIDVSENDTRLTVKRNEYALPQAVVQLTLTKQQLNDSLTGHELGMTIAGLFIKEDRNSRIEKLKKAYNKNISEATIRNFGFRISVPEDFFIARNEHNFMWLRRETSNTTSAILIYSVPLQTDRNPVSLRDSVTKIHISGPAEGSYMIVNHETMPLSYNDSLLNLPAVVTRGLWKVEKDFMGGPFVNFYITDTQRRRILCLDVFVYAPKFNKREYMNKLIAMAYSAEAVH